MIRGGCLCGEVRFEISGELLEMCYCHCKMCQRIHGTPFGSYAAVRPEQQRYTRGAESITEYRSSADGVRTFCRRCGSKLTFRNSQLPDEIWIAAGTLDEDPGIRPTYHIFVDSKAAWFEISDDLKQYPGEP
jgi:hypothetical protein